jgi:imidazole glycerol-phosphate synthase subunit HisF
MRRVRVIPIILIDNGRAVITRQFRKPIYVGDPINAIKILNEKEVDELIILDITSKKSKINPDFKLIEKMASESFMPLAYGGNVTTIEHAETLINCGIEKISFNSTLFSHPEVVKELSYRNGKQSVVASLDVKKNWLGRYVVKTNCGKQTIRKDLKNVVRDVLALGVGEILLNSIDKDGSLTGYDEILVKQVADQINVPLIACGGASSVKDFARVIRNGRASAVAAGALFFFKGGFNAVLVNYPDQQTLKSELYAHLE